VFLERLEISGFKSFARRTQIRFSPGITAVVGPNGCGKSNIADAIRWALGEQNVRSLRGKNLLDVIFKGTREVKPAGMAEITLHLDNQDQRLATEYAQVGIQRRAFRSGESEFLINKAPCRLKDIRNLFLDTGLGSSQYAVIEREMIDEVLSDRDDARRFLIDETSGITRYKIRRRETLRKIEAVERDLTRVEDVLEIEERQVRSLAYQMGKARRYRRLSDRIQKLDVALARLEWQALRAEAADETGRLQKEERARQEISTKLQSLETRQEEHRLALLEQDRELSEARKQLQETEGELAANREDTLVRRERRRALEERQTDLAERIGQVQEALARGEEELTTILPQLEAQAREVESKRRMAAEAERQWSQVEGKLRQSRQELARHQQLHIEQVRRRSEADHRVLSMEGRLADLGVQQEKTQAQCEALTHRLGTLEEEIGRFEERRKLLEVQQAELRSRCEALETQRRASEDRIRTLNEGAGHLGDEIARLESRLALLDEQARTFEGYQEGVAELLGHREELPGLLGVVSELLTVDPEWAVRLGAALREPAEWVVTRTEQDAWDAIDYLRARGLGQVTFVPLRALQIAETPAGLPEGVIRARKPEAEPLAALLRSILIPAESREAAVRGAGSSPGCRYVTPDGEVIASDGWIGGGGDRSHASQLWNRPQEIEELKGQLSDRRGARQTQQAACEQARSDREELGEQLKALGGEQSERANEIENLARGLLQKQAEKRLLLDEADRLRQEESLIAERARAVESELEGSRASHSRLQEEEGSADAVYQDVQKRVDALGSEKDELSERLSEKKMELLWAEARQKELQGQIDAGRQEIEEQGKALEVSRAERRRAGEEIEEIEQRIATLIEEEGTLVERRETRAEAVDRLTADRARRENDLAGIEKQLRETRRALSQLEESLRTDEVRLARFEADRQRLRDRIQDQYGLDLDDFPPLVRSPSAAAEPERSPAEIAEAEVTAALVKPVEEAPATDEPDPLEGLDEEAARELLNKIRHDRDRLGPVNQLAIEEYESKREHVRFVRAQRDDLLQSRDSLLAAIERINNEARRLFEETFVQLQENFSRTFTTLFPGGEAKLRLAGDDPLEADIEIMARPRGKRLATINLLSSGERALTATALLFALYLIKPSPFCVLDEVDAPLDDANIDRFLNLLRAFSEKTQFVVITHNKRTMEVADSLYGVTMPEPGISKIVSVLMEGGELVTRDREAQADLAAGVPASEG